MKAPVGILGLGIHLPPDVRKNDWWPADVVRAWREQTSAPAPMTQKGNIEAKSDSARLIHDAMASFRDDPFHGAVERRVLGKGQRASVMEAEAGRNAIADAGIDPQEIGLVLTNTVAPDYLITNNAPLLHHNLGLSPRCLSMSTESAANSFMHQIAVAAPMIASGAIRYALLVQSSNMSALLPPEEPVSPWFGDGASAAILGLAKDGFGVLSQSHRTHGEYHGALVAGVPGGNWWEGGPVRAFSADETAARGSFLRILDFATEVASEALANAGLSVRDVDFYGSHQPTSWFRAVTQKHLGLARARHFDMFPYTGSVAGATIPLSLALARKEGVLRSGDVVLMYAGGIGLTYSSMIVRWV